LDQARFDHELELNELDRELNKKVEELIEKVEEREQELS
jgi:hypothetical protein